MKRFAAAHGEVTFEDRYWPIVISTWFGTADLSVADGYFDAQAEATRRARAEGVKLIVISDALNAKNPPAVVRRRIAERSDALEGYEEAHAQSFLVLRNSVVRGALTAIQWLTRKTFRLTYVGTCAEALEQGVACLETLGQPVPHGLDPAAYTRPAPSYRAAG